MNTQHFDYIVIGGGSGGYAAARTARETLENVAIVDDANPLGGLCILRGCMPSKKLIYSAEVLHLAQNAASFGLDIPEAKVDMKKLQADKQAVIAEFADYRQQQLEDGRFTLFRNRATFISPDTIELDDGTQLTADHFMIATGSVVSTPAVKGLAGLPCWTSDDVLSLDFVPEKVIVLGGGIVACELTQFMRRVGTEVIQVQRSAQILKEMSPEASAVIETVFREEGIQLYTDTALEEVQYADGTFSVSFTQGGKQHTVQAPHLMNALGRRPNTDQLGLDKAGVEVLRSGHVKCDDMQQSSNPRIYASGDVAGPHEIVHVAIMQGENAARHATGRPATGVNYDDLLGVVFTDPQIGNVGLSEAELKRRGIDYIAADFPFDDHGKGILMGLGHGFAKVFAEKNTGVVLGAECVSKDAGELIHSMAVAVTLKATVADLLKVHWYHPTLSEIWSNPLEDIAEELA